MFWIGLLIIHGLLAFALLGAITHQAASLFWKTGKTSFVGSYVATRGRLFTNAIIVIYVLTFAMGSWIYTHYRYTVRPILEDLGAEAPVGVFEFKEHMLAISLVLLPVYWLLWQRVPLKEATGARKGVTLFIAVSVWVGFIGGHITNNARGFM